ncbi:MAG: hypothetical protein MSH22_03805 [Spirochaetia bacterium]|nr:hypothetical protein [Treponema sp.]MCI6546659.1 hypothetical protein [Spirochaetia bacterium]MCI7435710.1 hypothetical protein [Spirochaetia bacterium]
MDLEKVKSLIEEFVDSKTVNAVLSFAQSDDNSTETINSIAAMFGYSGSFESEDEHKLVQSFKNNLKLLIEKTWVEKSDIALKEQILFQLEKFCNESDWTKNFSEFLTILNEAVYLMFGQQTKSGDFGEYSLRIDPGFGIFWWYVKSLPATAEWPVEKCRNAVLLGMYFLANY